MGSGFLYTRPGDAGPVYVKRLNRALLLGTLLCFPVIAEWTTLKQWAGTGAKETETFQTEAAEWRINWTNISGGLLQITVYDEAGKIVSLIANTTVVGKDTSYVHRKGRFYLTINAANSRWSVSVEDNR